MTDKTPKEYTKEEIGKRAAELLADPILKFILDEVEAKYMQKWKAAPLDAVSIREACWLGVKSLEDIYAQINSLIAAPKVEAFNKSLRTKHK